MQYRHPLQAGRALTVRCMLNAIAVGKFGDVSTSLDMTR